MVHIIPRLAITTCEPTRFVLYSCHFNNDNGGGGGGEGWDHSENPVDQKHLHSC